jgi:hypothetical protein
MLLLSLEEQFLFLQVQLQVVDTSKVAALGLHVHTVERFL